MVKGTQERAIMGEPAKDVHGCLRQSTLMTRSEDSFLPRMNTGICGFPGSGLNMSSGLCHPFSRDPKKRREREKEVDHFVEVKDG